MKSIINELIKKFSVLITIRHLGAACLKQNMGNHQPVIKLAILGIMIPVVFSGCLEIQEGRVLVESDVQVINMKVDGHGWSPDKFVLQKGVKVKWNIHVANLTNCNKEIIVPDYGLDIKLKSGENIVEFTPDETGVIKWSCWMNMIPGSFIVVNDTSDKDEIAEVTANDEVTNVTPSKMSMH